MGQLGVRGERGDLEKESENQGGDVDVRQRRELGPVARDQWQRDVEHEEEHEERAHAQSHLAAAEGPPVPPPAGWPSHRLGYRHRTYVGTPGLSNLTC